MAGIYVGDFMMLVIGFNKVFSAITARVMAAPACPWQTGIIGWVW